MAGLAFLESGPADLEALLGVALLIGHDEPVAGLLHVLDGDAEVDLADGFQIPSCDNCGGILKPDVVFFGESVPSDRVEHAMTTLDQAEALLVAGTSLSVNSGLRFARRAAKAKKPIIIVNLGVTKGDELASVKIEASTSLVLERLLID